MMPTLSSLPTTSSQHLRPGGPPGRPWSRYAASATHSVCSRPHSLPHRQYNTPAPAAPVPRRAQELQKQAVLAVPLAVNLLFNYSTTTISLTFIAHLGTQRVAAASLATSTYWMFGKLLVQSLCGALDTRASQVRLHAAPPPVLPPPARASSCARCMHRTPKAPAQSRAAGTAASACRHFGVNTALHCCRRHHQRMGCTYPLPETLGWRARGAGVRQHAPRCA